MTSKLITGLAVGAAALLALAAAAIGEESADKMKFEAPVNDYPTFPHFGDRIGLQNMSVVHNARRRGLHNVRGDERQAEHH